MSTPEAVWRANGGKVVGSVEGGNKMTTTKWEEQSKEAASNISYNSSLFLFLSLRCLVARLD